MGTTGSNNGYSVTVAITNAWWSGRTLVYTAKLDVNTNGTYYIGLYSEGSLSGTGASTASHASNADLNGQYTSTRMFDITGYVAADAAGNAAASVSGSWGSTYPFYYNGYQIGMSAVSASDSGSWHIATPPTTPTFNTITRTTGTGTFSIKINASSSPVGTPTYYVRRSENGGAYGWTQSSTGTSFTFTGASLGSTQQFNVYATNADGSSGSTTSGTYTVPNVPGTPGPVTVSTPAGRAVTVTTGAASANNATVDAYYAQASSDNGITWGSDVLMTQSGANYTVPFTNLTGGKTYAFRARAHNEMGYGAYSTAVANVFVPAGGKRFDTTLPTPAFVNVGTVNRRNETNTAWVGLTNTKKYLVSGTITNAVGNGSSVTYTASNVFTAASSTFAGDVISITGVSPASYNLTNVRVTSCSATQFTVASTATGNYSSSTGVAKGWCDLN